MNVDDRTPVIIGVGQVTVRPGETPLEPSALMAEALRRAEVDSGRKGAIAAAQTVRVVSSLTRRYKAPARLVAQQLGLVDVHTAVTTDGGNSPGALLARTARSIQAGELDVALLCGGESWRTSRAARRDGVELPWAEEPDGTAPDDVIGSPMEMSHPAEVALGIRHPTQVYPLFEDAYRAHVGRTPAEQSALLGQRWSRFSEIAAGNSYAWDRTPRMPDEIATPSPGNRMVSTPYTKLLCSNEMVDQGAGVIVCSVEAARRLGVPADRWVFPVAAGEAKAVQVSEREHLWDSPIVRAAGQALFAATGVGPADIAYMDLYSCFPSAVQIQAAELGIDLDRDLTVTGGMRFAGGPWNNYPMHAVATTVERLRADPTALGLVTFNGGVLSKQVTGLFSAAPPAAPFQLLDAQAEVDALPTRTVDPDPNGTATIEASTITFDKHGPVQGIVVGLLDDGRRGWGLVGDAAVLRDLVGEDLVGRRVELRGGRAELA